MDRNAKTALDLSLDTTPLWNGEEAPQITLLREKMRFQYNLDKMTNKRVHRICYAAGITVEQLCAMAGVFGKRQVKALYNQAARREAEFKRLKEEDIRRGRGKLRYRYEAPRTMWIWPWPIALSFAKIEKYYFEMRLLSPAALGPDDLHLTLATTQS